MYLKIAVQLVKETCKGRSTKMPPKNNDNQRKVFSALDSLAPELAGLAGLKKAVGGNAPAEDGLRVEYLNLLLVYPTPCNCAASCRNASISNFGKVV
jgi:hypothetical protein